MNEETYANEVLPPRQHLIAPKRKGAKTRPFVERNKEALRQRKHEKGCDRCGYKGPAVYFFQPDGQRSCAQDVYVSERIFLTKLKQARALCFNCHCEESPPKFVTKKSCKVVHSTPSLAKLASRDPEVAKLAASLGLQLINPFTTPATPATE